MQSHLQGSSRAWTKSKRQASGRFLTKTTNFADTHDYGFEVPARSRRELTLDAHAIHAALGYKGAAPFPIVHFVEWILPFMFDNFELAIETQAELGGKFGETYPHEHIIRLREDIYSEAITGDGFARMTVAHEVGHLLEHSDVPLAMARKPASKRLPAYRSSEWQANAFAGTLLMPACKILDMSEDDIAHVYQVSIAAATIQKSRMLEEAKRWGIPQL